jgi:hypothetical protein
MIEQAGKRIPVATLRNRCHERRQFLMGDQRVSLANPTIWAVTASPRHLRPWRLTFCRRRRSMLTRSAASRNPVPRLP